MNAEKKILKFLIENNNQEFTINSISKKLDIDYKNAYQAIMKLKNILNIKKVANLQMTSFNFCFNHKVLEIENLRRKNILKNKDVNLIYEDIISINYPFLIVLLFGSRVNKTQKDSDIDLCIICDNQRITKKLIDKLALLSLDIHTQSFSIKEFSSMLKLKENNLAKEIIRNNIILFGIEDYYKLIAKWMQKELKKQN